MKLFLTSSPCDNNVPAGCGLPCVYFERNDFVRNLKACVDPSKPFVVVAAYPDQYLRNNRNDEMLATFTGVFAWYGMAFPEAHVIDGRNRQDAARLIRESGNLLLSGGHVPTENRFFHELGLRELLQSYDGVIMGISAGSMNCCDQVYAQPEEAGEAVSPDYRRFITGLGLTNVMILPHYNMVHDNMVDGLHLFRDITIPDSVGRTFYILPDGSYVLTDGHTATLYGEAWRAQNGVMEKLQEDGQTMILPEG